MALGKAIEFVKQAGFDKELRTECNSYSSKNELLQKLGFDEVEFDDAVNMQLVKCQTYEDAEIFRQIRYWFLLL